MVVYPDHIIDSMYVLVSAFRSGNGNVIPVKLEVKKNVDGNKPLYVVVSHGEKINKGTVNPEAAADGMNDSNAIRPNESGSSVITIPQILSYVNSNFEGFVKYFPDELLSVNQQL